MIACGHQLVINWSDGVVGYHVSLTSPDGSLKVERSSLSWINSFAFFVLESP
jgi:hypothetical protein